VAGGRGDSGEGAGALRAGLLGGGVLGGLVEPAGGDLLFPDIMSCVCENVHTSPSQCPCFSDEHFRLETGTNGLR
jgi:hypothetical protein